MNTDKNLTFSNDTSQPIDKIEIFEVADLGTNIPAPVLNVAPNANLEQATLREPKQHDIKNFMGRRYPIGPAAGYSWSTSQLTGTVLGTLRLPDEILSKLSFSAKVRGFKGFKFSFTIEAEITSQPMQAGQLFLSFCHNARYNTFKAAQFQNSLRVQSGAMSQKLNICDGHKFSLSSKYSHPFIYFDLIEIDGTLGDVFLTVASPLNDVVAIGKANVKLFAYFYDIELEMPVGNAPALLRAGNFEQALRLVEQFKMKPTINSLYDIQQLPIPRIQSNDVMTASVFKQKALPNMATSHSSSFPHVLALSDKSDSTGVDHGHLTNDDMSFSNILSRQCYVASFPWADNAVSETVIYTLEVKPNMFAANGVGVIEPDYIQMLGEKTTFWSGSIEYEFDIIATQFHHGRLRFAWAPGASATDVADPGFDHFAIKSIEVDVSELAETKDSSTHSVSLPCTWPVTTPQLLTSTFSGTLYVMVIQPLIYPDTVSGTVQVTVWRKGMSDLVFQLPRATNLAPVSALTRFIAPSIIATSSREQENRQRRRSKNRQRETVPTESGQRVPIQERLNSLPQNAQEWYNKLPEPKWDLNHLDLLHAYAVDGHHDSIPPEILLMPYDKLHDELRRKRSIQPEIQSSNTFIQTSNNESNKSSDIDNRVLTTAGLDTCGTSSISNVHDFIGRSTIYSDYKPVVPSALNKVSTQITSTSPPSLALPGTWVVGQTYNVTFTIDGWYTGTSTGSFVSYTLTNVSPSITGSFYLYPNAATNKQTFTVQFRATGTPTFTFAVTLGGVSAIIFQCTFAISAVGQTNPVAIQPYIFNVKGAEIDDLSFWSSIYTYARGGVDLKFLTNNVDYTLVRDPTNSITSPSASSNFELLTVPFTIAEKQSLYTALQQFVSPRVEGFGEVRIPFDAKSSAISINNRNTVSHTTDTNNLTANNTKFYLNPSDLITQCTITRSATPEFKFFLLNGPSFLAPNV